jgi:hypothetical protein
MSDWQAWSAIEVDDATQPPPASSLVAQSPPKQNPVDAQVAAPASQELKHALVVELHR